MTTRVEPLGDVVRLRAEELAVNLSASRRAAIESLCPRIAGLGFTLNPEEVSRRLAWWLLGQWLTGFALDALHAGSSFEDAENWFYGDAQGLPQIAPRGSAAALPELTTSEEVWALLPYLLDPLSPGTRRHLRRSEERHAADRAARKAGGIFYTPADLAQWMVSESAPAEDQDWTCLDPACGSGVFLRASLALSPGATPFGVDIDPFAVEMATFVVLATDFEDWRRSPWCGWHSARSRFATMNALHLVAPGELDELARRRRADRIREINASLRQHIVPLPVDDSAAFCALGDLFPALERGADVLLCNPPYAALGDLGAAAAGFQAFEKSPPTPRSSLYLPFVELAWRTTRAETGRASLVVPLSLACHQGNHFRALRKAVSETSGRWECCFFDRAPDALFGDDVKTRNMVMTYRADAEGLAVTELLRWTSRSRKSLFPAIRPVEIDIAIESGIPKLSTRTEAELLKALRCNGMRLGDDVTDSKRVPATAEAIAAWPNSIFVSTTAYNWFNCLRNLNPSIAAGHNSEAGFHALAFGDSLAADAAYAVVASRVAFWLWRVESDAFHVGKSFLLGLPVRLGSLSRDNLEGLAELGREVWASSLDRDVVAVNRGRKTVAFPPMADERVLRSLDAAVADVAGIDTARVERLSDWHRKLVVVDDTDHRRNR